MGAFCKILKFDIGGDSNSNLRDSKLLQGSILGGLLSERSPPGRTQTCPQTRLGPRRTFIREQVRQCEKSAIEQTFGGVLYF